MVLYSPFWRYWQSLQQTFRQQSWDPRRFPQHTIRSARDVLETSQQSCGLCQLKTSVSEVRTVIEKITKYLFVSLSEYVFFFLFIQATAKGQQKIKIKKDPLDCCDEIGRQKSRIGRSIQQCRCLDTPLLKVFKSQEGGKTDSGREFQSLPVKGMKE